MSVVGGYTVQGRSAAGSPAQSRDPLDDLGDLSDGFVGSALGPRWSLYEGDGTIVTAVANSEWNLTCNAGGAADSFWFDAEQGILPNVSVRGNFSCVATVRVRNSADSGLPTVGDGNFRIAGMAAHDPNRASLNYVHVGLGCTASAAITCEWKTTVNSVSTYNAIPAPSGSGQLRMDRIGQLFNLYYRAAVTDAWSLAQAVDRSANPMPTTVQLGFMVYSNVAGHDERLFIDRFELRRL